MRNSKKISDSTLFGAAAIVSKSLDVTRLVVLQNLTSPQLGILLQVVQLHDRFNRCTTMLGD